MNPAADRARTRLADYDNSWYSPGRGPLVRAAWIVASGLFLQTWLPWPNGLKRTLLRAFGARIGRGVVIKPRVIVKYPWLLEVGDDAWIGEGVWLDTLARIRIGPDACLSQGCMVETGSHDSSTATFDLRVSPVDVEAGAWAAAGSLLLPGSRLATHSVLAAGAVLHGDTEAYTIYAGVPARRVRARVIGDSLSGSTT